MGKSGPPKLDKLGRPLNFGNYFNGYLREPKKAGSKGGKSSGGGKSGGGGGKSSGGGGKGKGKGISRNRKKVCFKCGKPNHLAAECWGSAPKGRGKGKSGKGKARTTVAKAKPKDLIAREKAKARPSRGRKASTMRGLGESEK